MRCCWVTLFVLLWSCKTVSHRYTTDRYNKFIFDHKNRKFFFVEKRELSFRKFSEGRYIRHNDILYLKPYGYDSCIVYKINQNLSDNRLEFYCENLDSRFNILYSINNDNFRLLPKGYVILEFSKFFPLEIQVKVPFPNFYGSDCYNIYDTLYSRITIDENLVKTKNISIAFRINYNYFNWVLWTDTLLIKNSKTLRSLSSGEIYKKEKVQEDSLDINYASRCLLPFFEIKQLEMPKRTN